MKQFILICSFFFTAQFLSAQDTVEGNYRSSGYFFHPTGPRSVDTTKAVTHISGNKYQVALGDLGASGYAFQFEIDNNNNLINWAPIGATPALPSSGFMDQDNPGNFPFSGYQPGGFYSVANFPNKYDPATYTFYMHYGYAVGSTGEIGYSRQVYEQLSFQNPFPPVLHSFSPTSGTALTPITITGTRFLHLYAPDYSSVTFGDIHADSVFVVSDTILKAYVSHGATGKVKVYNGGGTDSLEGFTFTPAAIADTQWNYMGGAGFSSGRSYYVNMASEKNNVPWVVYVDSLTAKAIVMKFTGNAWTAVGMPVSDGKCSKTNILIDKNNVPVVAYCDSTVGGAITVKRFNGTSWVLVGSAGFGPWKSASTISISTDKLNAYYVLSVDTSDGGYRYSPSVYKFSGTAWSILGQNHISQAYWDGMAMAVDTVSNIPYILFADAGDDTTFYNGDTSIMKFNGTSWTYIGQRAFTQTINGIFYPDMAFDAAGIPYISFQEDDGFERLSVYKFSGGNWNSVGSPKFSKGRAFFSSLALDKAGNPIVLFRDEPFRQSGTVRNFSTQSSWDTLGARGFCPSYYYYSNSLVVDSNNIPMVAISDFYHGGKVSVLRFSPNRNTNDSLCAGGNISFVADNNTSGNTYLWQGDAGAGYVNLVNNGIYSGVSTNNLFINAVPSSFYGYKYRCIITNAGVSDTGAVHQLHFVNRWTGAVSNAWENPANWSCNSLPDANTDVLVNSGTVVINSNVIIRSLQVNTGVSLSIGTGFNLTVLH